MLLKKKIQGHFQCQKVLSVLILFQTVCKGYQQTTKVAASKDEYAFLVGSFFKFPCDDQLITEACITQYFAYLRV